MSGILSNTGISRRQTLALAAAGGAGALLALATRHVPVDNLPAEAQPALATTSLGAIAMQAGILFGASIGHDIGADYAQLYARETRILTTDTALKFDYLRPTATKYNFAAADKIIQFADAHQLPLRGHTLMWNENAPRWLNGMNGREIERVFDAHIEKVVSRYAGRLHSWDVVNEPFWPLHGKAGGFRAGPWFNALGAAYVPRAFARVHALDKSAKLCLNEAHCDLGNEWGQGIRPRLLELIDRMLDKGVPLDAVGLQSHLVPEWGSDDALFEDYLGQIAARGIDIYITELDISDTTFQGGQEAKDAAVAARYASFLQRALAFPQVKIVQTWQLADRYSWYRNIQANARPLPFDENLQPKAARNAIAAAFQQRRTGQIRVMVND